MRVRPRVLVPLVLVVLAAGGFLVTRALDARHDDRVAEAVRAEEVRLRAAPLPAALHPSAGMCGTHDTRCLESDLGVEQAVAEAASMLRGLGYRVDPPVCGQASRSIRSCRIEAVKGDVGAGVSVTPRLVGTALRGSLLTVFVLPA